MVDDEIEDFWREGERHRGLCSGCVTPSPTVLSLAFKTSRKKGTTTRMGTYRHQLALLEPERL